MPAIRRIFHLGVCVWCAALLGGCAEDVILPVDAVCGNSKLEGPEECDVESPGCQQCTVVQGWTCTEATCKTTCGDEIVAGGEQCDPPDGISCDSSCRSGDKAEACDMTGYWITRETDFSVDDVLNQIQTSSAWYAYRIAQTGDTYAVEQSLACGIQASGTADINLTAGGVRGLLYKNPQHTQPRQGSFVEQDGECVFEMDRQYNVRGAEKRFLPEDFSTNPDLESLPPLPYEDNPERKKGEPFGEHLDGAVDDDGDGLPGILFVISGNANGARNVVQRDWDRYFTDEDISIPTHAIEFQARCEFDNQENILVVTGCPLLGCGVLLAGSVPAPNRKNRVTFRYLGKELSDPRVSEVVVADMLADEMSDLETCKNVREALPHDRSKE